VTENHPSINNKNEMTVLTHIITLLYKVWRCWLESNGEQEILHVFSSIFSKIQSNICERLFTRILLWLGIGGEGSKSYVWHTIVTNGFIFRWQVFSQDRVEFLASHHRIPMATYEIASRTNQYISRKTQHTINHRTYGNMCSSSHSTENSANEVDYILEPALSLLQVFPQRSYKHGCASLCLHVWIRYIFRRAANG